MKRFDEIISRAAKTLQTEADSVKNLTSLLGEDFVKAVESILATEGRVVITGIGKSAIIAQKITATLNSTGTPAIFMHAADAIHGDLGIIQKNDVVICISKSGNTPEIRVLLPLLRQAGNILIALCGNAGSYLAKEADLFLDCTVDQEACPNNLAPTSSTTAQLALGDALAVCLLDQRGFRAEDFARYHPGGSLGKKLYLKVGDLSGNNARPAVPPSASVKDVIMEISSKRLGATVVEENGEILGIITDGDLRRMLEKETDLGSIRARDIMKGSPRSIEAGELAVEALRVFREHDITQLVVTKEGKYEGFIHFHDLLREGIIG